MPLAVWQRCMVYICKMKWSILVPLLFVPAVLAAAGNTVPVPLNSEAEVRPLTAFEKKGNENRIILEIVSNQNKVGVYRGADLIGYANSKFELDRPGSHRFEFKKSGYATMSGILAAEYGMHYKVAVNLEAHTGFMSLQIDKADALITLNGKAVQAGRMKLKTGSYLLRISCPGYRDVEQVVRIKKDLTAYVSPQFIPIEFRIDRFKTGRLSFNPEAPGRFGTLSFEISATDRAEGHIEIVKKGVRITEVPFTIDRFHSRVQWDGKTSAGTQAPDGIYTARLVLTVPSDTDTAELTRPIMIDYSQNPGSAGSALDAELPFVRQNSRTLPEGAAVIRIYSDGGTPFDEAAFSSRYGTACGYGFTNAFEASLAVTAFIQAGKYTPLAAASIDCALQLYNSTAKNGLSLLLDAGARYASPVNNTFYTSVPDSEVPSFDTSARLGLYGVKRIGHSEISSGAHISAADGSSAWEISPRFLPGLYTGFAYHLDTIYFYTAISACGDPAHLAFHRFDGSLSATLLIPGTNMLLSVDTIVTATSGGIERIRAGIQTALYLY